MIGRQFSVLICVSLLVIVMQSPATQAQNPVSDQPLKLSTALNLANNNDPWLKGSELSQSEIESLAVAAGQLPDPKMSVGLMGIGADTFHFNQEGMTQLAVGLSQMFPRGQSRSLSQERLNILAQQYPHQRQNRKAELAVQVSQLWLSAYQAQESIRLINKDRSLFEYLVDVAEASYVTASGNTRQQDLIRAQLELTRLDDRLTALHQNQEQAIQQLNQFIGHYGGNQVTTPINFKTGWGSQQTAVSLDLPHIKLLESHELDNTNLSDNNHIYQSLSAHPAVKALQQRIEAEQVGVELARQKYKPEWGVNASYGYRANADNGMQRADMMTVGITFDLPLFSKNRQDQELKAAIASSEAIETEKDLLLRKMMASLQTNQALLERLKQRQDLYNGQLLPQMSEQAEASLTAYTNDDGDFAEVVRARIAELNARIDALKINIDIEKTTIKLNYLLMTNPEQVVTTAMENSND